MYAVDVKKGGRKIFTGCKQGKGAVPSAITLCCLLTCEN